MDVDNGFGNPLRGLSRDRGVTAPGTEPADTSPPPSRTAESTAKQGQKEKPMEMVAPPGHGSGCGHCTAQARYVPKEQAEQARKEQKAQILNDVIKHEAAHASAAGHLGGAPVVRQSSDGSASGEVPVTIPKINKENPEETMRDGDTIMKAAMAPDKPSAQDYRVAQTGSALKAEAASFKGSPEFKALKPDKGEKGNFFAQPQKAV